MNPFSLNRGSPMFDIASYARSGPGRRMSLTPALIEQIRRTVTRAPEVMVKVSSGKGANTTHKVNAHFTYLSRGGEREIETDAGERLRHSEAGLQLISDWDLDLQEDRAQPALFAAHRRKSPKLVHKIIFSMPAGTPPQKVLAAVRDFAGEEFAPGHRYALVLHTDEPHPHVHVVVKAVNEAGVRLDIRKATLRRWRAQFARQLRAHGVEANATDRHVRGQSRAPKRDPVFRAARRGDSSHMTARVDTALRALKEGSADTSGAEKLQRTRAQVVQGWQAVRELLMSEGHVQLADQVERFVSQMRPPLTERQWLAAELMARARQLRSKDKPHVR